MRLNIDPSSFTIGDLEDFEDATGKTLDEALKPRRVFKTDDDGELALDAKGNKIPVMEDDPEKPGRKRPATELKVSTKVLLALIWICGRRDNESFTMQDARNVKVTELALQTGEVDADDPKDERTVTDV